MSSTENKFVAFVENSNKEKSSYICFLQYNGNEEELNKLYAYIKAQENCEGCGDMSEFSMDIDTLFSEQTVDENLKLKGMNHTYFYKCIGKFQCPLTEKIVDDDNDEDNDEDDDDDDEIKIEDVYQLVEETFYACRIIYMFK